MLGTSLAQLLIKLIGSVFSGNFESDMFNKKEVKPLGMDSIKYNDHNLTFYGRQVILNKAYICSKIE